MLKEKLLAKIAEVEEIEFEELEALCNEVKGLEEENEEVKALINKLVFDWYYRKDDRLTLTKDDDGDDFVIVEAYGDFIDKVEDLVGNDFDTFIGYTIELSDNWGYTDEYTTCSCCYKAIRTQPDCYAWTPNYYCGDGEILCNDCCKENIESIVEQSYINNPRAAITMFEVGELEGIGFELLDTEYENGWYGVRDNPSQIFDKLIEEFEEVIFVITSQGQFSTEFKAMVRGEREEEVEE